MIFQCEETRTYVVDYRIGPDLFTDHVDANGFNILSNGTLCFWAWVHDGKGNTVSSIQAMYQPQAWFKIGFDNEDTA